MREGVYLEKMAEFAALLRHEGLTVGLRETEDMCRILSELDLADRGTVYAVLSSLCAKSREEQAVFRRAFDGFFVSAEQRQALRARHEAEARELAQRRAEAERDLQAGGNPIPLREDLQEVYVRMGEDKREQLRQMLEKTQGNLERNPKLYGNFIRSVFMRFLLEQQMAMEDAAVGSESLDPDLALLYRDISQFRETDIPRAAALVSAIARQLDAELSRARRGGGHSGKLDFKRTIRRGLETGGTFYRLSYRPRRQKRRRLVLLCDVSGSMLQFSKTFLFSEELCRVNPFALQNMDAFRDYVRSSGLYGRGTDLGRALEDLCAQRPGVLGPSVTLLILSDTKTIDVPRAARALLEARRQAGKVLWLNPIPQRKWPYVRSIQTMSMLCQMAACSTLEELSSTCRRILQG